MIKLNRGMIKLEGGADSPGSGSAVGAFCRVVEDADPYGGDAVRQTELVGAGVLDSPLGDDLCADGRFVKRPYGVCFLTGSRLPSSTADAVPLPPAGEGFFLSPCILHRFIIQ